MPELTLASAQEKDNTDPLSSYRDRFNLPENVIYLDGNSLGAMPNGVQAELDDAMRHDWGQGLIRSWNDADWLNLPQTTASMIAPLIGAASHQVVVADSTSVNLYKVLSAALTIQSAIRANRTKIVTEASNFPTDNYIAEGVIKQMDKGHQLVMAERPLDIINALDDDVAVLMLTHVNYRNGFRHDMDALTKAAHAHGILVIWDLAHSAGAVPVNLDDCHVDFAVGCGYKYLNGGPGAPGFLYVAEHHLGGFKQPLSGWFAHQSPFAFAPTYAPSDDINQYLCGTPPVLSTLALKSALSVWDDVDMNLVRVKSLALTDYFIELVEAKCASHHDLNLITPRDHGSRGSQVSYTTSEGGYAIISALITEGVIGDFRAPDILRFGFTPLYTSFADVWHAVGIWADILTSRRWDAPQFHHQKKVT